MTSTQVRAREYLRVSLDRSGRQRSLEEQHKDNERAASSRGWSLGEPYRDNSVSASRYSRKARGGFAELMADIDAGRFDAEVLMLWESSRGSRRVGEWAELIDACAKHSVGIFVFTHDRLYDLTRGQDRHSLHGEAADSEYESSKVSDRAKRAAAGNAAAGKPHGPVSYGYRRTYDPRSGALLGQEPHPDEEPVVRELFARIVAGHSLRGIARDFEERGILARGGKPFSGAGLRSLAVKDAYAGRRVHDPGRRTGTAHTPDVQITKGTWEPLVGEADFLAVQRILSDPSRRTNRPGRGVHLLSMIARCDVCGGPLAATNRDNRGPQYQCHTGGHVRVSKPELDDVAVGAITGFLVHRQYDDDPVSTDKLDAARAKVESIRVELDELGEALGSGALSATTVARAEPGVRARLAAAEREAEELATPTRLRGLVPDGLMGPDPGSEIDDKWDELTMATKREIARIVLAPGMAGALRVTRTPTPGRTRTHAKARIVWQQ